MDAKYKATLDYLFAALPMFHRIGPAAYKADLDNTYAIAKLLKNPENAFPAIHVAGTNGKGSTSHMMAAILQRAGYKTGLYTSPHLKDFRERIRVNGAMIPEADVISFVEDHKIEFEKINPSFFEWTVGLAFDHFRKEQVDIAVVEVGLGGRLDSTNIVNPKLCIITSIGMDHANLLGDTLQLIAAEKAGIMKKNVPVVISEKQAEVEQVFREVAKQKNAVLHFATDSLNVSWKGWDEAGHKANYDLHSNRNELIFENIELDLPGMYQARNLPGVFKAVELLNEMGMAISDECLREALTNVSGSTGLRGRWECISKTPRVYADTGHNEDGIREILRMLMHTPHAKLHWVFGMMADKDAAKILKLLPEDARYYFCAPDLPRALGATILQEKATEFGLSGKAYLSIPEALQAATEAAGHDDLVLVGGSTFVVAEVI